MNKNYEEFNVYKFKVDRPINKIKILILVLCVIILICLILIIKNTFKITESNKFYKQYEAQLQMLDYQEKEKQAKQKEDEERKKRERIPVLTEIRKSKY